MEAPGILTNRISAINKATSVSEENHISKLNNENDASMIRESNFIRNPYQHPNHKRKYINQLEYQYYSKREHYKHPVSQKIELGWADSFITRQFCSTLCHSYRLC